MLLEFMNSISTFLFPEKLTTIFGVALILLAALVMGRLQADEPSAGDNNAQHVEHDKLLHKLQTLFIRKVDLHNASIQEALQFLIEESEKSDPEHQGINFVLEAKTNTYVPLPITMKLTGVTATEVLASIRKQSGFAYSIGDSAIYIWHDDGEGLTRRTFMDVDGSFVHFKPDIAAVKTNQAYDVRDQLRAKGLKFAPGTSAVYLPEKKELIVTNDPDQIELLDELLNAGLNPMHVTQGTKFIEIPQ